MSSYPTRTNRRLVVKSPFERQGRRGTLAPLRTGSPRYARPDFSPPKAPKTRHFPLARASKSAFRFIPGVGVAMLGVGVIDAYTRKKVPFPHPILPTNKTWYIRHGPNSYPGTVYDQEPTIQSRTAYLGNPADGFGPETGKIGGQAISSNSRFALGSVVPDSWGAVGIWIPNTDASRWAQYMHIRATSHGAEWPSPGHIRAENLVPHPEYFWPALDAPAAYPMPSPLAIPPGQPAPLPRSVPSPSWPAPPMPGPLAPKHEQPARMPAYNPEFGLSPSQVPAPTLTANTPGQPPRFNQNGVHELRSPRPNEKEKKGNDRKRAFRIGDLAGSFTELLDIHKAAYDAIDIPAFEKTWYYGRDVTSTKRQLELTWKYAGDIDIAEFVKNLLIQNVQDEAIGRFYGQAEKGLGKNRLRGVSRLSRLGSVGG